jgi:peroxiredoxin|tara:strand:- start:498 stop:1001 length:504 start_codon:yes stop_codon:yes gene_type:complete
MQDVKLFDNRLLFKNEMVTEANMAAVFGGKRIVMFGLPGAFTPKCSNKQLPEYEDLYEQFINTNKVDDVYCISVNDCFVMNAWGKDIGVDKITLIPDGNGALTRQLGMLVDKPAQNLGQRSWRYSSYIVNGIVKKMFIEPGINNTSADEDPYEESTPEKILDYVKSL